MAADSAIPAFPGAMGWAAQTPGGRGGRIIKVTTLAPTGPGSLREALDAKGPRIVVFEVGGVIDLGVETAKISEPFLTIAGQTAPQPGITLIRGGIDITAHDVIVQHIRVRPGDAGLPKMGGNDFDAISTVGAYNVIVDHCSLTWASDENLSASGTRQGRHPGAVARGHVAPDHLQQQHHRRGPGPCEPHQGRALERLADPRQRARHPDRRQPVRAERRAQLFSKGGTQGWVVNNLIYNPGQRAIHYNLIAAEWAGHPYQAGRLAVIGNVMHAGPDTPANAAFFMFGGSGELDLYLHDNIAVDRIGNPIPMQGRYTTAPGRAAHAQGRATNAVRGRAAAGQPGAGCGDRERRRAPVDRDDIDRRILENTIEGRGHIIDSQDEVGGYPRHAETRQAFVPADWNLDTMEPLKPLKQRDPLR